MQYTNVLKHMINKNILTFIIFCFLCLSSTDIKGILVKIAAISQQY